MSSLRINHQSRTVGETKPSETGRADAPVDGVSFALRLGAAGLVAKGDIPAPLGGETEDVAADTTPSAHGKRGEARGKPDDAAALVLAGSLGTSAADLSGSPVATIAAASRSAGAAAGSGMPPPAAIARDIP